jgi:SAM-dependent methyltransferase
LLPELRPSRFQEINIDQDSLAKLGQYDLVICSNVLEHLANPGQFINSIPELLKPEGRMYLSWTNWLSPWGGHEFSPFHYFGSRRGHLIFDWLTASKRKSTRIHTPFENLFPTYVGSVLSQVQHHRDLRILRMAPRYYPELGFLMRIPLVREFLTWNAALLIGKREKR